MADTGCLIVEQAEIAIAMPHWHPPTKADYSGLRDALVGLNQHVLFDTPEAPAAYKEWYTSRPWAETEGYEGEFCIIQVDEADP